MGIGSTQSLTGFWSLHPPTPQKKQQQKTVLIHVFERHKQLKFPNLEKERAVSWEASKPFSHGSLLRGWTETVKGRKRHSETAPLIPVVCVGSEGSLCPAGRGERKHLTLCLTPTLAGGRGAVSEGQSFPAGGTRALLSCCSQHRRGDAPSMPPSAHPEGAVWRQSFPTS